MKRHEPSEEVGQVHHSGTGRTPGRLAILIAALLPLCWLSMQIVHEAGHIAAAWLTGGTVTAIVLHPLAISRTDVSPNPHPLVVVWGGPIMGTLLPTMAWLVVRALRMRSVYLWRFFAGFCLVANGVYIGYGVFEPVGDASDLLRLGTPLSMLAVFGLLTVPAGFALWHGQGHKFGLGKAPEPLRLRHVRGTIAVLLVVVSVELLWSPPG